MIIVIGDDSLCLPLKQHGYAVSFLKVDQVQSLTALILNTPELTDIVLTPGVLKSWSLGHVLTAAKQISGKIIALEGNSLPGLIHTAESTEALLKLLQGKKATADDGEQIPVQSVPVPAPAAHVLPLKIPAGKLLFVGVCGSQRRIGCTTQAVGLYHYFKKLGFCPAITCSPEQIAAMAAPMRAQEIQGGYEIEGIPFVTNTALSYDCYIIDAGVEISSKILNMIDLLILVAGVKPWELNYTAAALRGSAEAGMVLLSFGTEQDGEALRPLFGKTPTAVMPWMPDLWHPSPAALQIYEKNLRPVLETALSKSDPQLEHI